MWIDSLCIIQDDLDDWLSEASQLHLVYSNSLYSMNATCSKDPSGDLSTARDTALSEPCEVEIPCVMDFRTWDTQVLETPLQKSMGRSRALSGTAAYLDSRKAERSAGRLAEEDRNMEYLDISSLKHR